MTVEQAAEEFWKNEEAFIARLSSGDVPVSEMFAICDKAMEIFVEEPFLLDLSSEVVVVGDIHGQFFDLLNILKISSKKYLFLGDFVDRGANSVETIILLFYMKTLHPESVLLLRGNHESLKTSSSYGFKTECMQAHRSKLLWYKICEVFNYLPICAVIDKKIFAVHAGIGPELNLEEVQDIYRVCDIPNSGVLADLLWSDPNVETEEFIESTRGVGYYFGEKQVDIFLKRTGLVQIIRSHQLVDEGYKEDFGGKVITIWSAPNYCYRCMNKAAVARIKDGKIVEYIEVPEAKQQRKETKILPYFI
ncbi:hypothetical protein NEIG_01809 [Nematocida sp. ERTm5]|nr:hypothetical protein NEIG_01809 [Nematocida sp. ERTm5]